MDVPEHAKVSNYTLKTWYKVKKEFGGNKGYGCKWTLHLRHKLK